MEKRKAKETEKKRDLGGGGKVSPRRGGWRGKGGSLTYLNVSSSRETKNGIHGIDAAAAPPSLVATA